MGDMEDLIELLSNYTVGSSTDDDITTAQLTLLQSSTLSQAQNMNGGRFTGLDFTRLHAYIILDKWVRKAGKGRIQEETVKENTWKAAQSKSSSGYMEDALQMIADFDNNVYSSISASTGVTRADACIDRLSDDWYISEDRGQI